MGRGNGKKGKKAFAHIKSRQHEARRLRTLQDVVSGELGAEYMVKHLPDTWPDRPHAGRRGGGGQWCSAHRTMHVGEDRRRGVAHPVAAPVHDRGAIPHCPSSGGGTLGGRVGHHAAACAAGIGGVCSQDGGWHGAIRSLLPAAGSVATPVPLPTS